MTTINVTAAIDAIARQTGVDLAYVEGKLSVWGVDVKLPVLTGETRDLFGFDGLLPTVPHGDDRDKLLWPVVAESRPEETLSLEPERPLQENLEERLGLGTEASEAAAKALLDRFFNRKKSSVMLPVHASLPLNFTHTYATGKSKGKATGYRMFNGGILPFLLWDATKGSVDVAPLERLLATIADDVGLTALDRKFLSIAMQEAPYPTATPAAQELIDRHASGFADAFGRAGGAFCQPSMNLFRVDLETVLNTDLPRPDKIQWLTLLLSLHLSVRMYRIAVVKGGELDGAVAAAAQIEAPDSGALCPCPSSGGGPECLQQCPLAGRLQFRTGSGRYRPVSTRDGCRSSYIEIDQRRLLDMPATLVTANLASRAWAALGGGLPADRRDLQALAAALESDANLRRDHDAVCRAITVLHRDAQRKGAATLEELEEAAQTRPLRPGLHALRDDVRKLRARDLRHQSRDVVNQLILDSNVGGPGSLVSRNGTHGFYEVDEQLLLLLVRLTCQDKQRPYEAFLEGLRNYGLAPQDEVEREALADALERLGLLARYSDAGEASFVHYA
jgi:hypothetical protein